MNDRTLRATLPHDSAYRTAFLREQAPCRPGRDPRPGKRHAQVPKCVTPTQRCPWGLGALKRRGLSRGGAGDACRAPVTGGQPRGLGTGFRRGPQCLVLLPRSLGGTSCNGPAGPTHRTGSRWLGTVPKGRAATVRRMTRKVALDSKPAAGYGPVHRLASHPYPLPSAQLPRGWGLGKPESSRRGVRRAAGSPAGCQHLNTLSSNCSWELGSHCPLRLQISLETPSGSGYELP